MLKVTNDGRKLALDQRMIDPMLPDDPESKVNTSVDNVHRIWEEVRRYKGDTAYILRPVHPEKIDGTFNVYDDIREKLISLWYPCGADTLYPRSDHRCTEKGVVSAR